MKKLKTSMMRSVIMELISNKFKGLMIWPDIEADIALKCAGLPEPTTATKIKDFIQQLTQLKLYLMDKGIADHSLKFIDEEIARLESTQTISLYEEEESHIDPEVIELYSRLGASTEGVVSISQTYNYTQLKRLTNGVFNKTGLVKFYISRELTTSGKIVAEIYEHPQKIPIATVIRTKRKNKEIDDYEEKVVLFGEQWKRNVWEVLKEISLPFYVYKFITEDNTELILISASKCNIGDYIITGVLTHCTDYKSLTDSAKLPTKLPYFFVQSARSRIIKFKNHGELFSRLRILEVFANDFFGYPFTIRKGTKAWSLTHPQWYKWLIWAWLTHQPKGMFNDYPVHLMIVGIPSSGKTYLLNTLHAKSKETRPVFSGAGSTLKHLIPSFKYNPAKMGYLAESSRFSFCDEFFRCLLKTKTGGDGIQKEESVALMNDLLEHQKREAGSGVSRININMTSRIIAASNPPWGVHCMKELLGTMDASFMSRWLVYYQPDDHAQIIKRSDDAKLELYKFDLSVNEWISILDYLHTFSAKYDPDKVREIYESAHKALSEDLNDHYDTRHKHHIECLMDGIVKARCITEHDNTFQAIEIDYFRLKQVWSHIIGSWLDSEYIKSLDIQDRVFYLPETCQYLYWQMYKLKKIISRAKAQEIAENAMSLKEFYEAWTVLVEMGLVIEEGTRARVYCFSEDSNEDQQRLED